MSYPGAAALYRRWQLTQKTTRVIGKTKAHVKATTRQCGYYTTTIALHADALSISLALLIRT